MRGNFRFIVLVVPALLVCGVAAKAGPITLDNFSLRAGSDTASGPNRAVLVREPVNGYLVTIESCRLGVCNTPFAPPLTTQSQPSASTMTNGIPTTLTERFHVDGVLFGQHVTLPFGSAFLFTIFDLRMQELPDGNLLI